MPEIRIAADEASADLLLAPGEQLASATLVNVLLARAGVRVGIDHAALAGLATAVGPAAVRVAVAPPGQTVMGRALPARPARPTLTVEGDLAAADGPVHAPGDVRVGGDVGVHVVVAALGDVHVGGDVAGGRVLAGGRVTVVGAIRREATIEAGGDVKAREVEAATIHTDGALAVTGDVVRAMVEAATLRVGGACRGSHVRVCGRVALGTPDDGSNVFVEVARPKPRALARVRAQRRAEAEAQLAKLRPMLDAPALDPAMRAKVTAAIAALEARLRGLG